MNKESIFKNKELKEKWQKLKEQYFNSKEISSETKYSFNFKNSNWSITIIYLITFVIIPIIFSLVKTYGFNNKDSLLWSNINLVFSYYIPIFGMILALIVDWKTIAVKGAWAAYSHFIFKIVSMVIAGLVLSTINIVTDNDIKAKSLINSINFLIQIVFQTIGSIIIILTNKQLRKQIATTFKEAKLDLLTWILIFLSICSILNLIFDRISSAWNSNSTILNSTFANENNKTDNQKGLELMILTPFGIVVLFISSIFLAPVNEELSYRYGIFSIVNNKWLAFVISAIYFPSMHIMQYGDWQNILGYASIGIMAPLLFIFTRGNVIYTIGLHASLNAIIIISLLANR